MRPESLTKLETVLGLGEKLYKGLRPFSAIQGREGEKIENALQKGCKQSPRPGKVKLSGIYGSSPRGLPDCKVFQRDLVAHGGWHSDVIELRVECREGRISKEHVEVMVTDDPVCRRGDKELSIWEVVDGI